MKILNEEFFKNMNEYINEFNLDLTEEESKCYANILSVLNDISNKQFTFDQLFNTYDFITDVIDGLRPDIMIMEDEYRDIYRLLKRYSTTKNLNDETRKKFAFVIYQTKCVIKIDEETNEPIWNMKCFENGTEEILKMYEFELKEYPSKFEIMPALSDPTKEDYGLSIDNPIEVISIDAEYQYLELILTEAGKPIIFERIGSDIHKNEETMIDIYEIYVKRILGKRRIATFYISGYGNENTLKAPKGFKLIPPED